MTTDRLKKIFNEKWQRHITKLQSKTKLKWKLEIQKNKS